MEYQNKVVDLTLSDNDDSDVEMLSLQERILLREKRNGKHEHLKQISVSPSKRMFLSPICVEVNSKEKDDSDSEFELPNLADFLGVEQKKISSSYEELKTDISDVPVCVEKNHSKQLSDENLAVRQKWEGSESDDGLKFFAEVPKAKKIQSKKLSDENLAVRQKWEDSESDDEFKFLAEAPKAKKIKSKKDTDIAKEIAKQEKIKLREEKKQEKELAKALKASEKEIQKSKKPDECLKGMKVLLDQSIIFENQSEDIFFALDEANIKYNIEENPINMSVMWCRTVVDISVENNKVLKQEREEVENTLLLVINNENFIRMVNASTLKSQGKCDDQLSLVDHISNIKTMFPHMNITSVVIGFEKYQKSLKENNTCNLDLKKISKQVSKTAIEEATIEVQIQAFVNFNFLNNMREFGDLLARFSKAIAEAPQRREKHMQKSLAFSWYADADSSCPVKLEKNGNGLLKLWQQQIQQFNNVGPEVAEAIVSQYPTLQSLIKAYKRCRTTQDAERLLQDIVVRRNYGPLGTQRRIGPELSYKIFLFYASKDGNQVLQR